MSVKLDFEKVDAEAGSRGDADAPRERVSVYLPPEAMLHTFVSSTHGAALECIQVDRELGRLAATDGMIAVVCQLPGLEHVPCGLPRVLLRAKGFERAEQFWKKSRGTLFLVCERVGESSEWSIECQPSQKSTAVIWSLPLETQGGMYPKINQAINTCRDNSHRVLLDPGLVARILDHARSVPECTSLAFDLDPRDGVKPIRVSLSNDANDAPECKYILMPMSDSNALETAQAKAAEPVSAVKDPGDYIEWQEPIGLGNDYPLPDGTTIELDTSGNGLCLAKIVSVNQLNGCSNARLVDGAGWVLESAASRWRVRSWPLVAPETAETPDAEAKQYWLWCRTDRQRTLAFVGCGSLAKMIEFATLDRDDQDWVISDLAYNPICSSKVSRRNRRELAEIKA